MSGPRLETLINRLISLAVPIGIAGALISSSLYIVPAGHRAVIFNRTGGIKQEVIPEGAHFLIPWFQRPIIYDTRTQYKSISTPTGSKDMQKVTLTLRVLYHPVVEKLPFIYSNLGLDYIERVLPSIGNEVLKAIVAQFDSHELITQRELVSQRIRDDMSRRAAAYNIVLQDVSLTHLAFGKEFTLAVEQKQVAQQEAERAKYVVEKAEQEKLASIIRAEGESQAAILISRAMEKSGNGMIELRRIEAAKEISATLSGSDNITYLPSGVNQNYLLNVSSSKN